MSKLRIDRTAINSMIQPVKFIFAMILREAGLASRNDDPECRRGSFRYQPFNPVAAFLLNSEHSA